MPDLGINRCGLSRLRITLWAVGVAVVVVVVVVFCFVVVVVVVVVSWELVLVSVCISRCIRCQVASLICVVNNNNDNIDLALRLQLSIQQTSLMLGLKGHFDFQSANPWMNARRDSRFR
ncbi:unnamed protein product [Polarella glacialis]|uniref:Uncharacterized protein n=1 Tax=Polarella glacialis TaxID=89957 RepID=A0A813ETG4_POLGL|nr:unnamed protein product [Polarella glacialis]